MNYEFRIMNKGRRTPAENSSARIFGWLSFLVPKGSTLVLGSTPRCNLGSGERLNLGVLLSFFILTSFFLISNVASASTIKAPIINLGLVGHWTFDGKDTYNGRISDVSGSANHGSASGIATSTFYDDGVIGQAGNFDGTDDYVSVANTTTLAPGSGSFTFAGWVKSVGPVNVTQYIYWDAVGDAQNRPSVQFALSSSDGKLYGLIRDASGNQVTVSGAGSVISAQNTWRHVVLVLSGKTLMLYVDGSSIGSNTNNSLGAIDTGSAQANVIGGNASVGGPVANFFNGKIDDVRIYTRALAASEITRLYNIGRPVMTGVSNSTGQLTSGLVGHWTFDGKNTYNGRIDDISGQANHGSATSIATSTFYTDGVIGQAGNFDGVNDRVDIANAGVTFDGATNASYSLWFNNFGNATNKMLIAQPKDDLTDSQGSIYVNSSNVLITSIYENPDTVNLGSTNIGTNSWHHVVVVMDQINDTRKMYLDGVLNASDSVTGVGTYPFTRLFIGSNYLGSGVFNGKIDDVRTYNRALSAAEVKRLYNMGRPNIVADFDKYFANVTLLLNMNGANNSTTFTDSSRSANTLTSIIGTTVNSTAVYKFPTASALMGHGIQVNGTGSNFAYGTGDFTIELWLRMTGGVGGDQNLYDGRDGFAVVAPRLYKDVNEKLTYFTAGAVKITGTTNVSQNVWHHIAVSRKSGSTRIFLDGVQDGSTYTDTNSYIAATSRPHFGSDGAFGGGYITGNLDEVRVTKGVGRYTSRFTIPESQFPVKSQ